MAYHNIRSYPFDSSDYDQDETQLNEAIRVSYWIHPYRSLIFYSRLLTCHASTLVVALPQSLIPFAVVGSERNVIVDGKPVRGRKNKWGVINVENEQHCDFNYLRNFLMRYVSSIMFFLEYCSIRILTDSTYLSGPFTELTYKT